SNVFFVDADTHPQTVAVLRTRAEPIGVALAVGDPEVDLDPAAAFGVLVSQPGSSGRLQSADALAALTERVHAASGLVVAAVDLLSLVLIAPPGSWGADIAVGSAQRF